MPALKALQRSLEKAIASKTFTGTSSMALRSYQGLHSRVADLLPDDYYVNDLLVLDLADDADEQQVVAQISLAVDQLQSYLEDMLGPQHQVPPVPPVPPVPDMDFGELGRTLRDRILAQTKDTIRRAMAEIDLDIDIDTGDRKRKVDIRSDDDEESEATGHVWSNQSVTGCPGRTPIDKAADLLLARLGQRVTDDQRDRRELDDSRQ